MFTNHIHLIYMHKPVMASNNLPWLICLKTKPNLTNTNNCHIVLWFQAFLFNTTTGWNDKIVVPRKDEFDSISV